MIPITKPFIPPINEYTEFLKKIWDNEYLTNNGPLVKELEKRLSLYLGTQHINLLSNGTISLQIALKALNLKGEIITTPFSYVATTTSILWEGLTPVFVDIDAKTLNIDPTLIESSITNNTSAILATHVYGNPCEIDEIERIAKKYNLKVIYDAAHCFGTLYKDKSVLNYGNLSSISFHATKIFHTIEGGALFTTDEKLNRSISLMRNFGHSGEDKYSGIGINGKNSELHAAMGLLNLKYINDILDLRKIQCNVYSEGIQDLNLKTIEIQKDSKWNCAYFPLILESESSTIEIIKALNKEDIYPRRYFYPSLDTLGYSNCFSKTKISSDISRRIICLPLYHDLKLEDQENIIRILKKNL